MKTRFRKTYVSFVLIMLCGFCEAQYSQIFLLDGKTIVMKEMECTNRILFLKRISNNFGPFAEIMEFSLIPDSNSFTRRFEVQLSNDSTDLIFRKKYPEKNSPPVDSKQSPSANSSMLILEPGAVPPPADYYSSSSRFAIVELEEKYEFGNIPKDLWDESGLVDLNFIARDGLVSFALSNEADEVLRSKYPEYFNFANSNNYPTIYENLGFFSSVLYPGAKGYYNTRKEEILVDDFYLTKRLLSKLSGCTNNSLIPVEVGVIEDFYCRSLIYREGILSFPDVFSRYSDNYTIKINDSLNCKGLRLTHRDLFSMSNERSILTLIANDSLSTQEYADVNQAYQILNIKLNEDGSFAGLFSYSLPQDAVFRIYDGVNFCPLVHLEGTPVLQSHVQAIKLYHHLEVLNNSCLDSDGTLVFFGYKGGLSEVIISTSGKPDFEIKMPSQIPKSGLFRLSSNGVSTFIPNDELFDTGVVRDSTVSMIQSKNGAHWLIGEHKEGDSITRLLMFQDSRTKKFKTYCTLPVNFKPGYLSEVRENVIAVYGEQTGDSSNKSFVLEKTKTNSILIVDVGELKPKRSKSELIATQVDLNSGHIYCSDLKGHKNYFFPIKMEVNAPDNYQGVVLLNGTEVYFKKANGQLESNGKVLSSKSQTLEEILSEVVNDFYSNKK